MLVQRLHGDLHSANILLKEGGVSGFLDHLPLGPAMYDLGYLLVDRVKRRIGNPAIRERSHLSHRILEGYAEIRRLSQEERDAIWPVMLAVQLLFAEFLFARGEVAETHVNLDPIIGILDS